MVNAANEQFNNLYLKMNIKMNIKMKLNHTTLSASLEAHHTSMISPFLLGHG